MLSGAKGSVRGVEFGVVDSPMGLRVVCHLPHSTDRSSLKCAIQVAVDCFRITNRRPVTSHLSTAKLNVRHQ